MGLYKLRCIWFVFKNFLHCEEVNSVIAGEDSEHTSLSLCAQQKPVFLLIGHSPRDANYSGSPWQQCSPVNSADSRNMKLEPRRLTDSKDICQTPVRRLSDGKDVCYGPRGGSSVVPLESPSTRRKVDVSPSTVGPQSQSQHSSPHGTTVHPSPIPSPHGGHQKYPSQSPSSTYGGILPLPGTPASPSQEYQCGGQRTCSSPAYSSLSPSPCRAVGSDTLSPSPCRAVGSDRMTSLVGSPWSTTTSPVLLPIPTQWTASLSRIIEAEQKALVKLASLYARLIIGRRWKCCLYYAVHILTCECCSFRESGSKPNNRDILPCSASYHFCYLCSNTT